MGDLCTVPNFHKRHLFHHASCTCIFLIICFDLASFFAVSQDVSTGCVLSYKNRTTPGNLTCEEGTWGGFLTEKCCKKPFDAYLYALARHSNQTGSIYLDSSEQGDCLAMLKGYPVDIMSCGFKRLTCGGGGCLDFNVDDVNNKLGKELRRFTETCGFLSHGDWNESCSACTEGWEDIEGIESDDDSCRLRNRSIIGFADPKLDGEYSAEAFKLTFKLALSCTGLKQERPSMERVVERLEKAHNISISARISSPQTTTD